MINKSSLTLPSRAEETVTLASLKGDVRVRSMLLSDRLIVGQVSGYSRICAVLSLCVFVRDDAGNVTPMFTADEWEIFGSKYYEESLKLFDVAARLSDLSGDSAEKKSEAPNTELPAA